MRLHLDVEIVNLYVYDGAQMVIVIDVDLLVHLDCDVMTTMQDVVGRRFHEELLLITN